MKAINTGDFTIKLIANGKPMEIKAGEAAELDSRTFEVLSKMFSLEAVEEKETIIEAEPQKIETKTKEKKNGKSKKSK